MSEWEYRVIKSKSYSDNHPNLFKIYEVHQCGDKYIYTQECNSDKYVYINEDVNLEGYSLDELRERLDRVIGALEHPFIDEDDVVVSHASVIKHLK